MSDMIREVEGTLGQLQNEAEELYRFMQHVRGLALEAIQPDHAPCSSQQVESIRLTLRSGTAIRDSIESLRHDTLELFSDLMEALVPITLEGQIG